MMAGCPSQLALASLVRAMSDHHLEVGLVVLNILMNNVSIFKCHENLPSAKYKLK